MGQSPLASKTSHANLLRCLILVDIFTSYIVKYIIEYVNGCSINLCIVISSTQNTIPIQECNKVISLVHLSECVCVGGDVLRGSADVYVCM